MKIKCSKCGFNNLEESEYCQECGCNLSNKIKTKQAKEKGSLYKEIKAIEDVIFKPKKKGISIKNILIGILVIGGVSFGGLMLLALLPSGEGDTTTVQTEPATFPISYLNITDYNIIFDDYGESFFVGTLKNAYSKATRNVKVRLDFYRDEALKQHFDTRTVTINNGAEPSGAFSFEIPLTIYTQDLYWWLWKIESADYGL